MTGLGRVRRDCETRLLMELDEKSTRSPRDMDNFRMMREWFEERHQCDWEEEKRRMSERREIGRGRV